MIDQQQKFLQRGIKAEFVGQAQVDKAVVKRVLEGDLQLLYISPGVICSVAVGEL